MIIGAGLIGLATARELLERRPTLKVVVLDKEATVAAHQSGHNSGVIHAGMYYPTGSLKAKLCVAGAAVLKQYCAEREIPVDVCGKLIVATSEAEVDRLGAIYERGVENGIAGLELVGPERIREIEPSCTGLAAVWSPSTAIVDFRAVARAYAADVEARGGELLLGHEVHAVDQRADGVVVRTARGEVTGSWLIACAGGWSDRVARFDGASRSPVDRALPRQLLAASAGADEPRSGPDLPGPRPALPLPRGPLHAAHRRRGVGRTQRAAGAGTRRLPAARRPGR